MKNRIYTGKNLDYIGFPLGGFGTGMFNIEGTGAFSSFSLKHAPNVNNEPIMFSAITLKGKKPISRVIESQVPKYKIFGGPTTPPEKPFVLPIDHSKAIGQGGKTYGLPRFKNARFLSEFPFANIEFEDNNFPLKVSLSAWSPFTPPNADDSSYPIAYVDYVFENNTDEDIEAVYYYYSSNFFATAKQGVENLGNGFIVKQTSKRLPWENVAFGVKIEGEECYTNSALYRGGWYDVLTMIWNDVSNGKVESKTREDDSGNPNPGACIAVPISIKAHGKKTVPLNFFWYCPESKLRIGHGVGYETSGYYASDAELKKLERYVPWYAGKFSDIHEVAEFSNANKKRLYKESRLFADTFFSATLPDVVADAISSNLTILKSPTLLRQTDGRLWGWEGCADVVGSCEGSCTHVYNYAQAICHLFPELERSLRQTEYFDSQNEEGHQSFRSALPIGETHHDKFAAADGQLGGIMKLYRDFIILGDVEWLRKFYPKSKISLDYCINMWDKKREGVLKEPHHNTYDIEFWGADGMCSSFYLGALKAFCEISKILNEAYDEYEILLEKGLKYFDENLFNGEYYIQKVEHETLEAKLQTEGYRSVSDVVSSEAAELMKQTGPRYQYANGCLSDGVVGFWMAKVCGLEDFANYENIKKHLESVYKYNFKESMLEHTNTQRPVYCIGDEAGLLLCTWQHDDKPALPFVYSDEAWTGIEYQVASHLSFMGETEKALEIIKAVRSRYDGSMRNPFDEYECGHWYIRALASYSLFEAFSGVEYNAYTKTLTINPMTKGDFTSFLSTNTGYALVGIKENKPFYDIVSGTIDIQNINIKN